MTPDRKQVLIADDEPNLRRVLAAQLVRDGYDVEAVASGTEAVRALRENHVDVVITDLRMPGIDGMELLKHVGVEHPGVPVIMITAHGTVDTAVEALKLGAFDYVTKPFDKDEFRQVVQKAARTRDARQKDVAPVGRGARFRIIGESPAMQDVYQVIEKVANTPSTVLLTGESGTGKELIARALHDQSARADKPFISVNCGAIPPDLIESELFGYEKGAFTGAVSSKPGRFELADGGTLFLDEIGEIPVNMQVKLLRALQEQAFERVGGIKTIQVDVRVVAATNRDLKVAIEQGTFREDLYYRLNVVNLHLPPLRERTSDIPLLMVHFLERFNERLKKKVLGVSEGARALIMAHPWKGNIRELENVMERCVLFCDGDTIAEQDLPAEVREPDVPREARTPSVPPPPSLPQPGAASASVLSPASDVGLPGRDASGGLKEAIREATMKLERELIVRALAQTQGNVTRTARLLKISRKSLQMKMKEFGLRDEG